MDIHYCEIPVKTKRFGITRTRQQGFLFSTLSWYLLYDMYGWDFDVIPTVDKKELMSKMVFLGARIANWDKGLPANFTLADVAQWIKDCPTEHTEKLREVYESAMLVTSEEIREKVGRVKKK